ncbi:T9SS type A sorting domain-containing protein [Pedobacter sp. UBA4863]|uniref:T9SS type A sorting domain-containing protein n=1 Tax=Pedobacter sp. UBA4863 TaxID=1947060 RepID=UPI0025D72647|nr:T9SS type A sorting domain-containing protein [Pedobacter sp. UBA4863]
MLKKLTSHHLRKRLLRLFLYLITFISFQFEGKAQGWAHIGSPNSTRYQDKFIQNISSAIHTNGDIYVAYHGEYTSVYVRKLNRATGIWEDVLNSISIFNSGGGRTIKIAITKSGTPIIAIKHYASPYNISLYKAGATQWEQLGTSSLISQYEAKEISLTLDKDDIPHILYQAHEGLIAIKKFINNSWVDVGDQLFGYRNGTNYISLAIDNNNIPYITYTTTLNYNSNAYVRKLINDKWELIGTSNTFTSFQVSNVLFALDKDNKPNIAFVTTTGTQILKLEENQTWTTLSPKFTGINYDAVMLIDEQNNLYISGKQTPVIPRLSVAKLNRQASQLEFVGSPNFTGNTYENALVTSTEGKVTLICTDRTLKPSLSARTYHPEKNIWELIDNFGIESFRTERVVNVTDKDMIPYVAYITANEKKAAVKKLVSGVWTNLGTIAISSGTASDISLTLNKSTPYICFSDGDFENKATVMSYEATTNSWSIVGLPGFTTAGVQSPYLTINHQEEMFITFIDKAKGNQISTMKFDSNSNTWFYLGQQGYTSPAKSMVTQYEKDGNLIVTYLNNDNKITALRWAETSWKEIGGGSPTTSSVNHLSMAIDNNNNIYLAYNDLISKKIKVAKNIVNENDLKNQKAGNEWTELSEIEATDQDIGATSIIVDSKGIPYVAYINKLQNNKIFVKRFVNNQWDVVGEQANLSFGGVENLALTISQAGQIYTAYNANGIFVQSFDTSVLPIKLSHFTAKKTPNAVVLNWQTQMEQYNKGFEIEKSIDGENFNRIDFVMGKNNPGNYSFTDWYAKVGLNYYRLKQLDFNGNFSYSNVVAVNFDLKVAEVSFYPNPVSNVINFINLGKQNLATIYDIQGRKVKEVTISNQKAILADLKPGIYFINIEGKKVKFIKL